MAVERLDQYFNILRDLGTSISSSTAVMELGCGAGKLVTYGRSKGYDVSGCDFILYDDYRPGDPELITKGILRKIEEQQPYRLPFDDCSFDVLISDQVLEHVIDYTATLAESHRVLRPNGVFLHIFPSRYRFIEPHVYVPLGTMVRARWWLHSWAMVGIRNEFQQQLSAADTCAANVTFLTMHTNYLSKRALHRSLSEHFSDVQFVERLFLKYSKRGRKVYELSKWLPFLPNLYSTLASRVVFGKRSR